MTYKAEIPYGAYWSTPFARWQGAFANLNALEFAAQGAFAGFLQVIDDQLKVATRLIHAGPRARQHAQTIDGAKAQERALGLE